MPVAELRIPADPAYVGLARLVVSLAARQAGVAPERVQDVKIAVDEAVASAVRAQAAAGTSAPIEVTFGATQVGFEVSVGPLDGPPSNVEAPREPSPELVDPELSLTIIEGLTDKMSYEQDGTTVCVRFVIGLT